MALPLSTRRAWIVFELARMDPSSPTVDLEPRGSSVNPFAVRARSSSAAICRLNIAAGKPLPEALERYFVALRA